MSKSFETIVILDFGSQYTQLIARRIRELGVYCEIHPYNIAPEALRMLLFGLAMVLIMLYRPHGLIGRRHA